MYRQALVVANHLEALDELSDVQMTLEGLATFAMALSKSDTADPEAIALISCLLYYCAASVEANLRINYDDWQEEAKLKEGCVENPFSPPCGNNYQE